MKNGREKVEMVKGRGGGRIRGTRGLGGNRKGDNAGWKRGPIKRLGGSKSTFFFFKAKAGIGDQGG